MGRWWNGKNATKDQATTADPVVEDAPLSGMSIAADDRVEMVVEQDQNPAYEPEAELDDLHSDPEPVAFEMEKPAMNTTFRLPLDRSGDTSVSSGAPTVIRAGLHLDGNIRTSNDILLEGSVRGEVTANSITVAAGATLSGTVSAAVIVVDGTVEGVVRCIKLQVNTSGAVSGEIHHSVLVVEAGAAIEGTVFRTERHIEEIAPLTMAAPAAVAVQRIAVEQDEAADA